MCWNIVKVQPQCEYICASRLTRDGYEIFLPETRRWFRPRRKRRPILAAKPAFSGYLFLNVIKKHYPTDIHKGHLLCVGGELAEVSDIEIEALRARGYLSDEFEAAKPSRPRHARGATVTASHDLLGSIRGRILESGGGQVRLELDNGMVISLPSIMIQGHAA
jgi:hypothetical protein